MEPLAVLDTGGPHRHWHFNRVASPPENFFTSHGLAKEGRVLRLSVPPDMRAVSQVRTRFSPLLTLLLVLS